MAKSVFITGLEANSGKFFLSVGLLALLKSKMQCPAYFKPVVNREIIGDCIATIKHHFNNIEYPVDMGALTWQDVLAQMDTENEGKMLDAIIARYKYLEEQHDFTIIEGTDYREEGTAFELDFNLLLAKNLCVPTILVVSGEGKTITENIQAALTSIHHFHAHHVSVIGVLINKVKPAHIKDIEVQLQQQIPSNIMCAVIPYQYVLENLTQGTSEKINLATRIFNKYVDADALASCIITQNPTGLTPHLFQYQLIKQAKKFKAKIVLPEGNDERILKVAASLQAQGLIEPILLGTPGIIQNIINRDNISLQLDNITIVDPATDSRAKNYADTLYELRKNKNMSRLEAQMLMNDFSYFGTMMVYKGDADGMVSGAVYTTQQTVRPALQIIKTKKGKSLISSIFLMCLNDRVIVFGDCAINPDPTASQLAEIAISSAESCLMFGIEPRIAMISYSSGVSGKGRDVEKVRKATELVKAKRPEFQIEGPIQYDAAVNPVIGKAKLPDSTVAGRASVFIFPDLDTANSIYKAVQQEAGAVAIGPILQNLNKPVNDLSRGGTVDDIFNTIVVTAIQCQHTY